MKTIKDFKDELMQDDRFDFIDGVFEQKKSRCCVSCTSKQDLEYLVRGVTDENGKVHFDMSFWKCKTCKQEDKV
ncbi:hypothetical protein [Bacillus toyonensis]|uniref:hypothetical protein n=1 Tax=Bacillus toyonensis TaxID=155322 RepID=UPI000BFA781A|nr:hypothetical protein [Bacillus toyonensis]PGF05014.1 hypothetical protein COM61_00845 [Bacillus toyonensis]